MQTHLSLTAYTFFLGQLIALFWLGINRRSVFLIKVIRYVIPTSQTAPIEWEKVTSRSFTNILKKFNVTVTKSDVETGTAQGDATLAGAVYGIFKGEELIDTYITDAGDQFTTDYYVCGYDWTIREMKPSEGYLLDNTIHKVGAEPELYVVERNSTANDVNEQVIKDHCHKTTLFHKKNLLIVDIVSVDVCIVAHDYL